MALVNCKECGKQVSTTAKTCPHCGVDNPGGLAYCILTVHRPSKFSGMAVGVKLYIDGTFVGEIKNGEILNFEVDPGTKIIRAAAFGNPSFELTLTMASGMHYFIDVKFKMLGLAIDFKGQKERTG